MSGILSDAELADMRADAKSAFPDTCFVKRRTLTSDSAGGSSITYANTTTDAIPCEVFTGGGNQEVERAGRIASETYWTVLLPYDTDIKETDRIVVGTRTLEVITITTPSYKVAVKISAVEVK